MEEFLEVFGGLKVATVVVVIAAIIFLWKIYKIVEKHFREKYEREAAKEKQLQYILSQIEQYPAWRKQSIDYQKQYADAIIKLENSQKEIAETLREIEEKRKKTERNKLRDRLLQSFRYYTSEEKNPMLAWSEMEADAYWKMFKDYEEVDGDGHMHTVVQPAMKLLEEIPMHETEKITKVMQSRR